MDATTACGCGKVMVRVITGKVFTVPPPPLRQTKWKCYGCGAIESAPDYQDEPKPDQDRIRWDKANGIGNNGGN